MAAAEGTQLTDLPLWFHERHENDRYRDEEKKDVKKHEQALQGNVKVVGDDVKMLEEKIAKLLA